MVCVTVSRAHNLNEVWRVLYSTIRAMKCLMKGLHLTRTKWTATENETKAGKQQSWGRLPCIEMLVPLQKRQYEKKWKKTYLCERRFLMPEMVVGKIKKSKVNWSPIIWIRNVSINLMSVKAIVSIKHQRGQYNEHSVYTGSDNVSVKLTQWLTF